MNTSNKQIIKTELGNNLDDNFSPLVENTIKSHKLPGLAIGIVADTEIVYAKGFGAKNIDTQEPISPTTIFHMASISKPFVATAIVQLVEKGQIQLDAPVVTYLPYFDLDDARAGSITVQQMLSHVSGMPDVEDYEWYNPQYDEGALERYVRGLTPQKLLTEPGTTFAYSNMAFECLGDVIAKVSGMSFADYVKKQILDPAGMTESTFLKPEHLPETWAAPHVQDPATRVWEGYPYNRRHGPSSTLHASAIETCNWAITNLQRGSFEGQRILDPLSYDVLWKPWAEIGEGEQMGLSWFLAEYRGERIVQHGGNDMGFRAHLVMLPDKMAAAVVLCNLMPAPAWEIACSALDIALGYEPNPITPPGDSPTRVQENGAN